MEQDYQLKTIICLDCKHEFDYSAGEQRFNQSLFDAGKIPVCADPKRCRECRFNRKQLFDRILAKKETYERGHDVI